MALLEKFRIFVRANKELKISLIDRFTDSTYNPPFIKKEDVQSITQETFFLAEQFAATLKPDEKKKFIYAVREKIHRYFTNAFNTEVGYKLRDTLILTLHENAQQTKFITNDKNLDFKIDFDERLFTIKHVEASQEEKPNPLLISTFSTASKNTHSFDQVSFEVTDRMYKKDVARSAKELVKKGIPRQTPFDEYYKNNAIIAEFRTVAPGFFDSANHKLASFAYLDKRLAQLAK